MQIRVPAEAQLSPMCKAFVIGMILGAAYGVFFAVFQGEPH
jgi:hypothetical protein